MLSLEAIQFAKALAGRYSVSLMMPDDDTCAVLEWDGHRFRQILVTDGTSEEPDQSDMLVIWCVGECTTERNVAIDPCDPVSLDLVIGFIDKYLAGDFD